MQDTNNEHNMPNVNGLPSGNHNPTLDVGGLMENANHTSDQQHAIANQQPELKTPIVPPSVKAEIERTLPNVYTIANATKDIGFTAFTNLHFHIRGDATTKTLIEYNSYDVDCSSDDGTRTVKELLLVNSMAKPKQVVRSDGVRAIRCGVARQGVNDFLEKLRSIVDEKRIFVFQSDDLLNQGIASYTLVMEEMVRNLFLTPTLKDDSNNVIPSSYLINASVAHTILDDADETKGLVEFECKLDINWPAPLDSAKFTNPDAKANYVANCIAALSSFVTNYSTRYPLGYTIVLDLDAVNSPAGSVIKSELAKAGFVLYKAEDSKLYYAQSSTGESLGELVTLSLDTVNTDVGVILVNTLESAGYVLTKVEDDLLHYTTQNDEPTSDESSDDEYEEMEIEHD